MKKGLLFALFFGLISACTPITPPQQDVLSNSFTSGRVVNYGAFYEKDSLFSEVVMLDIYSDGVALDENKKIVGTGTNLCFSDIFLPPDQKQLQEGITYQSQTTGEQHTFLPGQNFDGTINGAYILQITDGNVSSITLIKEGSFTLTQLADTTQINFQLVLESGKKYAAQYRGILPYEKP